jgi:hypothetical protein
MLLTMTILLAALLLAVALYAQYRIPFYTAGTRKVAITRATLFLVGAAFGYVNATGAGSQDGFALSWFFIGFGLVHAPAALILFIKRRRGTGMS